jgi:integrase
MSGSTLAPATFAQELGVMNAVFEYAVELGLVLANPARQIKRRKLVQAKITIHSREQFRELLAATRQGDGRSGAQRQTKGADLVELLAYSGCRIHEAVTLRWANVDFEKTPSRSPAANGARRITNRAPRR